MEVRRARKAKGLRVDLAAQQQHHVVRSEMPKRRKSRCSEISDLVLTVPLVSSRLQTTDTRHTRDWGKGFLWVAECLP